MELLKNIEALSDVMMGKPCLKGTRNPVYLIPEKLGAGETLSGFRRSIRSLTGTT